VIIAVFALLVVIFVILPLAGVALFFVLRTLIIGLIMGALGRLVVPGAQPIGFLATVCCGWIGALVGGAIGSAAHFGGLATTLVMVAVSAGAVAIWSGTHRKGIGGRPRRRMLDRL
jgi:uncharacterized membrane protein YeaQ/YmgE (transglycosylase-associated protein family)